MHFELNNFWLRNLRLRFTMFFLNTQLCFLVRDSVIESLLPVESLYAFKSFLWLNIMFLTIRRTNFTIIGFFYFEEGSFVTTTNTGRTRADPLKYPKL